MKKKDEQKKGIIDIFFSIFSIREAVLPNFFQLYKPEPRKTAPTDESKPFELEPKPFELKSEPCQTW